MILCGIDEAGYGPTLGPLVVAGAAFRIPEAGGDEEPDLWKILKRSTSKRQAGSKVWVNDSKKLYCSGKGLRHLEEAGLSFLQLLDGKVPSDFRGLLQRLSGVQSADRYLDLYPWYRGRNMPLPRTTFPNYLTRASLKLGEDARSAGVELLGIRALPMEVLEFNRSLERLRNKARVPFLAVGSLLLRIWRSFPGEPIVAMVDRQGGRTYYGPLLYRKIRPHRLTVLEESDDLSIYHLWREEGPGMRVIFAVDCESRSFPTALASIFCKYLRELHMSIFNTFWVEQVEKLRLTAGYHLDAQRFLSEIAEARRELGIDDAALIRRR